MVEKINYVTAFVDKYQHYSSCIARSMKISTVNPITTNSRIPNHYTDDEMGQQIKMVIVKNIDTYIKKIFTTDNIDDLTELRKLLVMGDNYMECCRLMGEMYDRNK